MRKFEVVEEYTEYVTKFYLVEAESEEQARQMVENGEVEEDDSDIYIDVINTTVTEIK